MRKLFFSMLLMVPGFLCAMSPSEAKAKLVQGNKRFIKSRQATKEHSEMRISLKQGQEPFAVVVACSDSRVAPEILFDQGIGDLFVIRVAGNVIGPYEMESILYAAKHLGSSYVLVMGHQKCGAVDAVIQGKMGDIPYIAQLIQSSVDKAKARQPKNLLQTAIELNAETMSKFIKRSPVIIDLMDQKKIQVGAAYYNFETGAVEIL